MNTTLLPTEIIKHIISYNNNSIDIILKKVYINVFNKEPTYNNINTNKFLCMFNYQFIPLKKEVFYSNRFSWGLSIDDKFKFNYHTITENERNRQNNNILKNLKRYDIIRCTKNNKRSNIFYMVFMGGDYFNLMCYKDFLSDGKKTLYILSRSKSIILLEHLIYDDLTTFFKYNEFEKFRTGINIFEKHIKTHGFITNIIEYRKQQKIKELEKIRKNKIEYKKNKIQYKKNRKNTELIAKKQNDEYKEKQQQIKIEYNERMKKADEFQKQTLIRIFGTADNNITGCAPYALSGGLG